MSSDHLEEFTLAKAPRRKLAETAAEQILEAIRTLPPGTKIPSETELMRMLSVGRSTVREALNGLTVLGVLDVRHGYGAVVSANLKVAGLAAKGREAIATALAKGVTHDLLEAREIVEVAIARLAAQRRTETDLREIEQVLEKHEHHSENPIEAASEFHIVLAISAHNEVLAGVFQSFLKLMVSRGPRLYRDLEGFSEWELDQHRQIYEAVRAGSPDLAADRMHAHVRAMAEHYKKVGEA
jgi:GntR family transcriptional repressor for pyruvate dehydrogenase complex